jgi:hypothetical protein
MLKATLYAAVIALAVLWWWRLLAIRAEATVTEVVYRPRHKVGRGMLSTSEGAREQSRAARLAVAALKVTTAERKPIAPVRPQPTYPETGYRRQDITREISAPRRPRRVLYDEVT